MTDIDHTATLPQDFAETIIDPKSHSDLERLHKAYTWARANNPLGRAELDGYDPFWVVTKHADVALISRDNNTFHNGDRSVGLIPKVAIEQIKAITGGSPHLSVSLVQVDNPVHKKLRDLTQSWFMPNSILKLDQRMRALAKATVDQMATRSDQERDFVHDVALHYPLHIVMDILGVPPEDEQLMLTLTQQALAGEDPELSRDKEKVLTVEERVEVGMAVQADFARYFAGITADRRANPRNDVASLLANAMIDGEPLDDTLRLGYYIVIATAGHDTTSSAIGTTMWALCKYPDLLPRLKANPALIGGLIEEAIRWITPVRHFMRTATQDTELRGRKIKKGDWLMLCYASANRDEEVFSDPFEFRIDRQPNRHLSFGFGAHVCLGQHLAKMEMRILLEELIPRLESVELTGAMDMVSAIFISGPKHLPVRYRIS